MLVVGCNSGTSAKKSTSGSAGTASGEADSAGSGSAPADKVAGLSKPKPMLDGWDKPALALVLSGEQHGYFEPCGCTEMQLGGMSRRDDLFKKIRDRGWAVTAVDIGGISARQRRQSQLKFETMLKSMRDMQYRALAIGPEELQLGLDFLLSMHVPDSSNPDASLSFLGANVVFYDAPELGTPQPSRIIDADGVKIGVTAIVGRDFNGTALMAENNADLTIKDPADVLPGVIAELKKQEPELLVLLSHTTPEESRKLSEQFPDFDLVLTAGGPEEPSGTLEKVGDAYLAMVGRKGKYVGVLGYYPNLEKKFRFELVGLDQLRFEDSLRIVEHMREYQHHLEDEGIAGNHQDNITIEHPSGSTYVGVEMCGECHTEAYDIWKETPHAHAFESLEHAREGAKDYGITRIYDAECLTCHVVGWDPNQVFRYQSGFINKKYAENDKQREMSSLLKGVQCENCHGPGSKHIALINEGETEAASKLMRVTLETAKKNLCYTCHDSDNSPDFDFDEYWPQVEHKGLE